MAPFQRRRVSAKTKDDSQVAENTDQLDFGSEKQPESFESSKTISEEENTFQQVEQEKNESAETETAEVKTKKKRTVEIGRASCRERV